MTCIRLAHLNVRSLLPKVHDVTDLLFNRGIDVLVLTETWLDQRENHNIIFNGYSVSRFDRDGRGGGVAVVVRNTFKMESVEANHDIEQVWVRLKCQNTTICVGGVYRPPASNYKTFLEHVEETFSLCLAEYDTVFCLGDFNIN